MLSVILPTYNEADNVRTLVPEIKKILKDTPHEIILVDDDSPDETWKVAYDLNIRVKRRRGVRGLASAVIEGFTMTRGDVLVVMDSDGQHDPKLLPDMYGLMRGVDFPSPGSYPLTSVLSRRERKTAIVIASRYTNGGSIADWRGYRLLGSRMVTWIAKILCPRSVTDPLSGYFAIDRRLFESIRDKLQPRGFKILLEILANLPQGAGVVEVPLKFGLRSRGYSKLSLRVQWEFGLQFMSLFMRTVRGWFALFCVLIIFIAMTILPRMLALRLVYLDDDLRVRVQKRIEDMALVNVTRQSARIIHRSHVRGPDPVGECFNLQIDSDYFQPCNES